MSSNPPPTIGTLVGLASRHLRRAIDLRLGEYGLTEATWLPLVRLARAEAPMRQKDLAQALSLDSSSVVRLLGALENAGLIERGADRGDRRAKAIIITAAGRTLAAQAEAVSRTVQDQVFAGIAPDALETTRSVLETMIRTLAGMNGDRQP